MAEGYSTACVCSFSPPGHLLNALGRSVRFCTVLRGAAVNAGVQGSVWIVHFVPTGCTGVGGARRRQLVLPKGMGASGLLRVPEGATGVTLLTHSLQRPARYGQLQSSRVGWGARRPQRVFPHHCPLAPIRMHMHMRTHPPLGAHAHRHAHTHRTGLCVRGLVQLFSWSWAGGALHPVTSSFSCPHQGATQPQPPCWVNTGFRVSESPTCFQTVSCVPAEAVGSPGCGPGVLQPRPRAPNTLEMLMGPVRPSSRSLWFFSFGCTWH